MTGSFQQQRIIVTGATGLVGSALYRELEQQGATVVRAVRRDAKGDGELAWNPVTGQIEAAKFEGASAVVHLAGENIAGARWTPAFKWKIRESRVKGTTLVAGAIAGARAKPQAFVCASAIGYYGNRGNDVMTESSAPGEDYLAEVCSEWEAACAPARRAGVRTANMRIGVILSSDGGALKKMLTPFKLGFGGVIGNGRQWMSWIAIDDVVGAIVHALANPQLAGPINAVAPNPATNRDFTKTLGRVLGVPTFFPMPAFAAKLAFGEMADALLLASTRVAPQALATAGYQFRHPELEAALRNLLRR